MVLFLCFIVVLTIWGIQYAGKDRFHSTCLDKEDTLAVKGIFLLFVFASHFTQYVEYRSALSVPYLFFRSLSGQMIVVPFLFYSGYGVSVSLQKKGYSYLKSMPLQRILRVLVQFDIAVVLFYLVNRLMGTTVGLKQFLLSLPGWDSIGNSNWYILAILLLYAASYLACMVLSARGQFTRGKEAGWLTLLLSLGLVWGLSRTKPGYYYNTLPAYSFGFLYCQYREKIERVLFRADRIYYPALIALAALLAFLRKEWPEHLSAYLAASVVFAEIIVMLTAKFRVRNAILRYCGKHLFSLYILQRLPMMVLAETTLAGNIPVFFLCSFVLTLLLSWLYDQLVPRLWTKAEKAIAARRR